MFLLSALPDIVRRGGVVGIVVRGCNNVVVVVVCGSYTTRTDSVSNASKGAVTDAHGIFPPNTDGVSLGPKI